MIAHAESRPFETLLGDDRLIPVIVLDTVARSRPLGESLLRGGIAIAEVTLRTPEAARVLAEMVKVDGLTVGAGSVTRVEEVDLVAEAGGQFIVSPGFSVQIAERAVEVDLPYLPGCATATDIMAALSRGLKTVKFFPAQASGGIATIRALTGPFPAVRFVPTGGISQHNYLDYLGEHCIAGVGGSWMVPPRAVNEERWQDIEDLCRATVAALSDGSRSDG